MKKVTTIVNFILDETGSMDQIKRPTIDGFNEYIHALKKEKGKDIRFTLTKFDSTGIRIPYVAVPVKKVEALNDDTYQPGAMTPLYDAVVNTIKQVQAYAKRMTEKPAVLIVIMTDGLENASRQYTQSDLTKLIQEQQAEGNWTFVFLGANQDSWATAQKWGIARGNIMDWQASEIGTQNAYQDLARGTVMYASAMNMVSSTNPGDVKGLNTSSFFAGNSGGKKNE